MLIAALQYCGALVTAAADAEQGKRLLRGITPHVIVTDISVPGDGFAMIAEVLAYSREIQSPVPAIAITSGNHPYNELHKAGFAAFIAKPLDAFVLAVVAGKLSRRRSSAHSGGTAR